MLKLLAWVYAWMWGAKAFVLNEVNQIKEDERGLELLQVLLIIVIVVIVFVALWAILGPWITDLLDTVEEGATVPTL